MTIRNSTRVHHEPGEIVWGRIFNGIEDNKSAGKWRPVVILESGDREHRVVGLTSQRAYKTTRTPRARRCHRCETPRQSSCRGDGRRGRIALAGP